MPLLATAIYDTPTHTTLVLRTPTFSLPLQTTHLSTLTSFSLHCDSLRGIARSPHEVSSLWGGPPNISYTLLSKHLRLLVLFTPSPSDLNLSRKVSRALSHLHSSLLPLSSDLLSRDPAALHKAHLIAHAALTDTPPPNLSVTATTKPRKLPPMLRASSSKKSSRRLLPRFDSVLHRNSKASSTPPTSPPADDLDSVTANSLHPPSDAAALSVADYGSDVPAQLPPLKLPDAMFLWGDFGEEKPAEDLSWFVDLFTNQTKLPEINAIATLRSQQSPASSLKFPVDTKNLSSPPALPPPPVSGASTLQEAQPPSSTSKPPQATPRDLTPTSTADTGANPLQAMQPAPVPRDARNALTSSMGRGVGPATTPQMGGVALQGGGAREDGGQRGAQQAFTQPVMMHGGQMPASALTGAGSQVNLPRTGAVGVQRTPSGVMGGNIAMRAQAGIAPAPDIGMRQGSGMGAGQLGIQGQMGSAVDPRLGLNNTQQAMGTGIGGVGTAVPVTGASGASASGGNVTAVPPAASSARKSTANIPPALLALQEESDFDVSGLGMLKEADSGAARIAMSKREGDDDMIRARMNEFAVTMQAGNFSLALQQVYATLRVLRDVQPRRDRETVTCATYVLAQKLLLRNAALERELEMLGGRGGVEVMKRKVESAIVTMFLAEQKHLLPKHRMAAMRVAVEKNYEVGNFGMCGRWLRIMTDKNVGDRAQLEGRIEMCTRAGNGNMHMPASNRICYNTLQVLGVPYGICNVCNAVYHPTMGGVMQGQICPTCLVGAVELRMS